VATGAIAVSDHVSLARLTTLELGGPARHLIEVGDEASVSAALAWARARGLPVLVLGGGSNVVVADAGFDGVVLRIDLRGVRFRPDGDRVCVDAAAGEPWDALVRDAVARGLAGIECLAGIPGLVGATPIQNVGAYGQEVAETIRAVRALDRTSGRIVELAPDACRFGYRDSLFKQRPDAYLVLGVTFALTPAGAPTLRYRELVDEVAARARAEPAPHAPRTPTLAEVSETVRVLRARKSMIIDAADVNRRSVGSFFTNPVLAAADAAAVVARALTIGAARTEADVPRFPATEGRVKLSAGWLIEHAGFAKGYRRGPVGLSSHHALALVHHGGGSTAALLALAAEIRDAVAARFGVRLVPEPVLVGAGATF
jgi:UDP-N-acetylmuramate dehydrogenase